MPVTRDNTPTQNGSELARDMANALNNFSNQEVIAAFVEKLSCEHRTLQQSATALMLAWFAHLSSLNENYYDLRNEHAVRVAKKIRHLLEEEYGSAWAHMPLI